jgi:carotenoid cleavage dioxygenase-like enzyme
VCHDVVIMKRLIIVPIPPVTVHFDLMAQRKTGADVMRIHRSKALRIGVAPKNDISNAMILNCRVRRCFMLATRTNVRVQVVLKSF